ncbi:sulfotransferase 1A1-like [Branchiostoma floridae x Branchiostoma belcheri]
MSQDRPSSFYFKGVRFDNAVNLKALGLVDSFEIRDDDVFISCYIKSGTTWTQQIVSLVCAEGDISEASKVLLQVRTHWLESLQASGGRLGVGEGVPRPILLKSAPSPRLMSTHLPYHLLPQQVRDGKGKIIYCARNVKDVVVSWHNMRRMMQHMPCGTWDDLCAPVQSPDNCAVKMYEEAEPVRTPQAGSDRKQPSHDPPGRLGNFNGHVHRGKQACHEYKGGQGTSSNVYEEAEVVKLKNISGDVPYGTDTSTDTDTTPHVGARVYCLVAALAVVVALAITGPILLMFIKGAYNHEED